jgi:hypothetical protein
MTNYRWLMDQRRPLNDSKRESVNDVIDRFRQEEGKD